MIDHRQFLLYFLFGVVTTGVNFVIYTPLSILFPDYYILWNAIAWVASVLFAFFTNKPFVFKSTDWSIKVAGPEFLEFVGCRIGSFLLETVLLWLTISVMSMNEILMKGLITVLVVIINYIGSKLLFKSK